MVHKISSGNLFWDGVVVFVQVNKYLFISSSLFDKRNSTKKIELIGFCHLRGFHLETTKMTKFEYKSFDLKIVSFFHVELRILLINKRYQKNAQFDMTKIINNDS